MEEKIVLTGNIPKNLFVNADDIKATREQHPETFGEVLYLLNNELFKMKVVWYGENFVDNKGEEFWFKGILFKSDGTLSIRDKDETIRVIMSGISYPLMWQIIESELKLWRNNEKNRTYTCNRI